jgi:hypothetical protein
MTEHRNNPHHIIALAAELSLEPTGNIAKIIFHCGDDTSTIVEMSPELLQQLRTDATPLLREWLKVHPDGFVTGRDQ